MTCKPFINAVNVSEQTLTSNSLIEFSATNVNTGCGIEFVNGGNAITVSRAGYYEVSFDADVDPVTAGLIGVQLLNNGNAVNGAVATFTGTANDIEHVHIQAGIHVLTSCKCVTNEAVLQIQLISGGGTISNANIIVEAVKL